MKSRTEAKLRADNNQTNNSQNRMICIKTPHGACVFCGDDVPEGIDVCLKCMIKYGGEPK